MTVAELIDALQYAPEDAEVRIAQQPSWPFEYNIAEVFDMDSLDPADDYEIVVDEDGWYISDRAEGVYADGPFETDGEASAALAELLTAEAPGKVVYLAEGRQLGYLPSAASRALGWR